MTMTDTEMVMLYRVGLVTETILHDDRITKLSTAVNRCAKQWGWTKEEADAVKADTRRIIEEARDNDRPGKPLTCLKVMRFRLSRRRGDPIT